MTFSFTSPGCEIFNVQSARASPFAGTFNAAAGSSFIFERTPPNSSAGWTVISFSVLLLMTAEIVTVSPTTKNLGASSRTMSGCLVRVVVSAMPNWFACETARAVAFQLVSESGYFTLTVAVPFLSVRTFGCQKTVERKSLRTTTAGSSPAEGFPGNRPLGAFARDRFPAIGISPSIGTPAGASSGIALTAKVLPPMPNAPDAVTYLNPPAPPPPPNPSADPSFCFSSSKVSAIRTAFVDSMSRSRFAVSNRNF